MIEHESMPAAPRFSVITVCRNASHVIATAATSLVRQTWRDWEWIVVDGASTDGTVGLVSNLAGGDPRVRITSEPDAGIYDAMNKGVRAARGDYLHFLNADDSYHDDAVLADIAAMLAADSATDFLYGNIVVTASGAEATLHRPPPHDKAMEEMVCGCIPHQGSFFRRKLFTERIGLFDDRLRTAADYKWMLLALSLPGVQVRYVDRTIAVFSSEGASAQLAASLPESFEVLNACTPFWEALGTARIVKCYQERVLTLRTELQAAKQRAARLALECQRLKGKLSDAREKVAQTRTRTKPASPSRLVAWLHRWVRR